MTLDRFPKDFMQLSLDCIPCIVNSLLRLLQNGLVPDEKKQDAMRHLLEFLARADYSQSPPAIGREMHRMIRSILDDPDPYQEIKKKSNEKMLGLYEEFKQRVKDSQDPLNTAMRLAIAGNVIDFGPQNQLDLTKTIDKVMHANLAIDDSRNLANELETAKSVLYIGDNCGEIVLDKLFVETLRHPNLTFAVRSGPTINDATLEDAQMIGLDKLAHVITTGDDSPGAVWEFTSDEFKQEVRKADVVIAKGQGNLEGLLDIDKSIYFLLTVKCPVIGTRIGAKTGDFILYRKP
jgi:damage-control phosphatase, subfamily I